VNERAETLAAFRAMPRDIVITEAASGDAWLRICCRRRCVFGGAVEDDAVAA
jgi:hypothetical protein